MSDSAPSSRQLEPRKKISKATFSVIIGVVGVMFMIMAYALGSIIVSQANDPANNAGIMPAAEWEQVFSSWLQMLSFFLFSGGAGGISSLAGLITGISARREIKRSNGSLEGSLVAGWGIAFGAMGVIMFVLALCATVAIFILAMASV